MTGSLGMFMPLDKGLAAVKTRTPWPLQGAFITAATYHLVVHDMEGYLGVWLRRAMGLNLFAISGEADLKLVVRCLLFLMWVIMQWGQVRAFKGLALWSI
jgi:hypothetical protein